MTPLQRQDLVYTAKQLPKIPHMDHERLILESYREGGWIAVDRYIDFAISLHKEINPNKSRREKIIDFASQCITKLVKFFTGIINRLKQFELR